MMNRILLILLLFPLVVSGQSTYKILADSTRLGSINGTGNTLIIENTTKDSTTGVLTNIINGRTNFQKLRLQQLSDTTFRLLLGTNVQGQVITIPSGGGGGGGTNIYNTDGTLTSDRTVDGNGDSLVFKNNGAFFVNATSSPNSSFGAKVSIGSEVSSSQTAISVIGLGGLNNGIGTEIYGQTNSEKGVLVNGVNNSSSDASVKITGANADAGVDILLSPTNSKLAFENINTDNTADTLIAIQDGLIVYKETSSIVNAGNGLTKRNDSILLGGTTTEPYTIVNTGDSTSFYLVDLAPILTETGLSSVYGAKNALISAGRTSASVTARIGVTNLSATANNKSLEFTSDGVTISAYFKGLPTDNSADRLLSKSTDSTLSWVEKSTLGTVTSVATNTGTGITGGTITTTGTLAIDTASVISSKAWVNSKLGSVTSGITKGTTTIASSTSGSIPYDSSGTYSSNKTFLSWDVANKRLGLGTPSPIASLEIKKDTIAAAFTTVDTSAYGFQYLAWYNGSQQKAVMGFKETAAKGNFYISTVPAADIARNIIFQTSGTTKLSVTPTDITAVIPVSVTSTADITSFNAARRFFSTNNSEYTFQHSNGSLNTYFGNDGSVGVLRTVNNRSLIFDDNGSVSIGPSAAINSKAVLTLVSTTKGFLPPKMTATQASAIASPTEGLLLYVTDTDATFTTKGWWGYDGAAWKKLDN